MVTDVVTDVVTRAQPGEDRLLEPAVTELRVAVEDNACGFLAEVSRVQQGVGLADVAIACAAAHTTPPDVVARQ